MNTIQSEMEVPLWVFVALRQRGVEWCWRRKWIDCVLLHVWTAVCRFQSVSVPQRRRSAQSYSGCRYRRTNLENFPKQKFINTNCMHKRSENNTSSFFTLLRNLGMSQSAFLPQILIIWYWTLTDTNYQSNSRLNVASNTFSKSNLAWYAFKITNLRFPG